MKTTLRRLLTSNAAHLIPALLLLTFGSFPISAEEPKPMEPTPILASVKNGSHWLVQITLTESNPTPNTIDRLKSIEVSKMKNTTHRIYTWSSGKTTHYWIKNRFIIFENSSQQNILVFDMNQAISGFGLPEGIGDFRKSDFPEIENCPAESLKGEKLIENRKVLFYEWEKKSNFPNAMMMAPNQPIAAPTNEQLWVDKETHLPVRWKRQQEMRDYKFTASAARSDELPKKFKETLDDYLSKLTPNRPPKIP